MKIELIDVFFFIIFFLKGLGLDGKNRIYIVAFALGCVVVFLKIFREKFSKKELMFSVEILLLGLLNFLVSHNTVVLFTAIGLIGMKNVDTDRVIHLAFFTKLLSFIILQILVLTGIVENSVIHFWRDGVCIVRLCMGYSHPNEAQINLVVIILLAIYLYGNKLKIYHYIVLGFINYLYYQCTFSRTGFLVCLLILVIDYFCKNIKIRNLFSKYVKYSYVFFLLFSIVVSLLYAKFSIIKILDNLLTGRIQYNYTVLTNGFPTIFGKIIQSNIALMDNGYLTLLYQGGVLVFCWYSYFIIKAQKNINEYRKSMLLFSFLLYSITESFLPSLAINVSLIFIAEFIYKKTKKEIILGKRVVL